MLSRLLFRSRETACRVERAPPPSPGAPPPSRLSRAPEDYAGTIAVLNAVALGVMAGSLIPESDISAGARETLVTAAWLHGIGLVTALGARAAFPRVRRMEDQALALQAVADRTGGPSTDAVRTMHRAAKLNQFGYRIMVIAGLCLVASAGSGIGWLIWG